MKEATNAAVLVIDDEEMVRNDIEEILMPRKSTPENESVDWLPVFSSIHHLHHYLLKKPATFQISQFIRPPMEWKDWRW